MTNFILLVLLYVYIALSVFLFYTIHIFKSMVKMYIVEEQLTKSLKIEKKKIMFKYSRHFPLSRLYHFASFLIHRLPNFESKSNSVCVTAIMCMAVTLQWQIMENNYNLYEVWNFFNRTYRSLNPKHIKDSHDLVVS